MINSISIVLTITSKELKCIISKKGEPGVRNISALVAKKGATPVSPATPRKKSIESKKHQTCGIRNLNNLKKT